MSQHFVEPSFQALFFPDLEYRRSLRWPRKVLLRKSKKQLPMEFSNMNRLVLFVRAFSPRNRKITARSLDFFSSPHVCNFFCWACLMSNFHTSHASAVIYPSPALGHCWILTRILFLEQPLLYLPWKAPLGVCLCIFSAAQGQQTRVLLLHPRFVMPGAAQERALPGPANAVGAQSCAKWIYSSQIHIRAQPVHTLPRKCWDTLRTLLCPLTCSKRCFTFWLISSWFVFHLMSCSGVICA